MAWPTGDWDTPTPAEAADLAAELAEAVVNREPAPRSCRALTPGALCSVCWTDHTERSVA